MLNGPIQKGFFVCHKCDVPTCVNPKHLYLGSPSDNQKDRWDKKRWKGIKAKKVEVSL